MGLAVAVAGVVAAATAPVRAAESSLDRDPALAAWWRFDETSGAVARDASGHGRDATLVQRGGGIEWGAGRVNGAVHLDGKARWVVRGFKGITGTEPRTVTAWIRTPSRSGQIVVWGVNDAGKMWRFGFIRGRIGVTPKGGYLYMRDATDDDQWHHVAIVIRAGSPPNLYEHARLYLDGEPAVIHDIGLLDLWPIDTGEGQDVEIGPGWKGWLDDVRIYQRALTEEEIRQLYAMGGQGGA